MPYVHHSVFGTLRCQDHETVLEACLRLGVNTPFSCRGGSCHTCMVRCTSGHIPERAQQGLSNEDKVQGHLLPCVCLPTGDLHITPITSYDIVTECVLDSIRQECGSGRWVWALEPMRALPSLCIGDVVQLDWHPSVTDDPKTDAVQNQTVLAPVLALPETHYFLEVQLDQLGFSNVCSNVALGEKVRVRLSEKYDQKINHPNWVHTKLPIDPQLWIELDQGQQVRVVLDAFYAKVFADPYLSPYFQHTSPHHVAGKQYAFLYQSMTGKDVYFGDNPYNAHHRMVISDELFDRRQRLMLETLLEHGLTDDQIRRWTAFEEPFRRHIVKNKVLPRLGETGEEIRPNGFGQETLTEGSVCDHCGASIEKGTTVWYHQQLGTISCPTCTADETDIHARQV